MTKTLEAGLREQIASLEQERDKARRELHIRRTNAGATEERLRVERDAALAQVETFQQLALPLIRKLDDCDHKRQRCEDIGCLGKEARAVLAAIEEAACV